jgi:CRP-like cAMP-binding protein
MLELFNNLGTTRLIPKGTVYIKEGAVFKKLFLVKKGIMRSYCLTADGVERTLLFTVEGLVYGAADCIFFDQPSTRFWHALEDIELVEMDADEFNKRSESEMELLRLRVQMLESLLMDAAKRLESFVRDSPEERYLELFHTKKELIRRIPDKYIASFIGVTPVSLSRIRKRLVS